ncbi:MAG: hypothetical protein GXO73_00920 [Calditrichaeota bacterium]|nr:hypothetical protein [Calditrichota bacterium]
MNLEVFTRHYKVKLVSFLMALFLWFYVVTDNTYQYEMTVPIRVTNLAEDRAILSDLPQKATIRVEGTGKALIGLMLSGDAWLTVDLTGVRRVKVFRPRPADVTIMRSGQRIRVLEVVSPDTIRVVLDLLERRSVPVVPEVEVVPAAGYALVGQPSAKPAAVLLSGPRKIVSSLASVKTERREYRELKHSVRETVPLIPVPKTKMEPDRVVVEVVVEKLMEKRLEQVPVRVENPPAGMRGVTIPPTVALVVQGAVSVVSDVRQGDVVAFVDYNKPSKKDPTIYPVQVKTPKGVSVRSVSPDTVRVVLERLR